MQAQGGQLPSDTHAAAHLFQPPFVLPRLKLRLEFLPGRRGHLVELFLRLRYEFLSYLLTVDFDHANLLLNG